MSPTLTDYIDGWIDAQGKQLTVVPRVKFPFGTTQNPDTYSRMYERDYEIPTWAPPRIDVRNSWTNLLTYSEDIDNAAWTKTNLSVTADNIIAPDGLVTMDKLLESSATAEHSITQAATVTAAAHELCVFVKGGLTRTWIRLAFTDSAAVVRYAFFNFTAGYAISPSSGTTAKILNLGNSDYYCILRFTPAAGAGTVKINLSTDGSTISYAGSTSAGLYLWGVQIALGSAVPYISTTSAARTVSAPDRDPRDPMAYLIEESDPDSKTSSKAEVKRILARIPRQQTIHGSRFIQKPDLIGPFPKVSGSSLIVQPEENVPRWVFYTQVPVTTDSGKPADIRFPTGGTFTATVGANTTSAIAANSSAATIKAAFDALSSVSTYGVSSIGAAYDSTSGTLYLNNFLAIVILNAPTLDTSSITVGGTGIVAKGITRITDRSFKITMKSTAGYLFTGGTFTISIFGQTTAAIAISGTTSTVRSALEALSNIGVGNVTVSDGAGGSNIMNAGSSEIIFTLTFPVGLNTMSGSGSSLTPSGSTLTVAAESTGFRFTFAGISFSTRTLYAAGHGISASDDIVITQGSNYRTLPAGSFTVTTDTIVLTSASGAAFSDSAVITAVGKQSGNEYTGGSKLTRIKRVTDFYLPGVSPGITTADDIPLPTYEGDDATLLTAIFSGDTDINYEVGELETYRNGPILMRTRTTLNASTL